MTVSSLALDTFRRLLQQSHELEAAASREEDQGHTSSAPIIRRSGFLLAVAAFDSYFHERGIQLLATHAKIGPQEASLVANYVTRVSAAEVASADGENHVRLRMSFHTLVAPKALDKLLTAVGRDVDATWLSVCFALKTRPDRQRRLLELLYDRRNQIAHEADWDVGRLDFRPMERAHLHDCITVVADTVEQFDLYL